MMNDAILDDEFQEMLAEIEHILSKYSVVRLALHQLMESQNKLVHAQSALSESLKWAVAKYGKQALQDACGNLLTFEIDSDEVAS